MTTATPNTIPTDTDELIRLLTATPAGDRYLVCERLETQLGDQARAQTLYERAESEVLHGEACDQMRRQVTAALDAAVTGLRTAEGLIARLGSPMIYDVEYAEGATAADLLHTVDQAHRAARIASLLQKAIAA